MDLEALVHDIRMNVEISDAERRSPDVGQWAEESFELARDHAYLPGGKLVSYVLDPDPKDKHPPADAPKLSKEYEDQALAVARKRIRLAGARLAEILKADLKD